jgi:hypothetical protein
MEGSSILSSLSHFQDLSVINLGPLLLLGGKFPLLLAFPSKPKPWNIRGVYAELSS